MKAYHCIEVKSLKHKKMFLDLPARIYLDGDNPQDYKAEKQILNGEHIISQDIEVFPYLILDDDNRPICRCLMTYYKDDPVAYLGFFESFNNLSAVKSMFFEVERKALKDGKTKILGPIDCSIYINYRFKIDRFDKTYTSEPYNKKYYKELWEKAGFGICDKYVSNQLRKVEREDIDERLKRICDRYRERGYDFISPNTELFQDYLEDVYELMMKMYSGFSGFKKLTKEQFIDMYMPLQKVMDFDMVRLVYNQDLKLCAFCICLPNYGDLTRGKITLGKAMKIKKIKKNPTEYIVLYLGADTGSAGLGGALIHDVRDILYRKGCTSIGALIKEGNVTGKMYEDLYTDKFNYVLLEKNLNYKGKNDGNTND